MAKTICLNDVSARLVDASLDSVSVKSVREAVPTGASGWTNKRVGPCCIVFRGRTARFCSFPLVFSCFSSNLF